MRMNWSMSLIMVSLVAGSAQLTNLRQVLMKRHSTTPMIGAFDCLSMSYLMVDSKHR